MKKLGDEHTYGNMKYKKMALSVNLDGWKFCSGGKSWSTLPSVRNTATESHHFQNFCTELGISPNKLYPAEIPLLYNRALWVVWSCVVALLFNIAITRQVRVLLPWVLINYSIQAYKDTVEKKGRTPPSLPSLTSYTDEQMFFIAFGQVCWR